MACFVSHICSAGELTKVQSIKASTGAVMDSAQVVQSNVLAGMGVLHWVDGMFKSDNPPKTAKPNDNA